jgi:hypothetical protein
MPQRRSCSGSVPVCTAPALPMQGFSARLLGQFGLVCIRVSREGYARRRFSGVVKTLPTEYKYAPTLSNESLTIHTFPFCSLFGLLKVLPRLHSPYVVHSIPPR